MALPEIKVLIAEEDGVEIVNTEYLLKAATLQFDHTDFDADSAKDATVEARINEFPYQLLAAGSVDTDRVFSYYDSTGGVNVTSGTSVLFNTIRSGSDTAAFSASSGEIEFKVAGLYFISAEITTFGSANARSESRIVLQTDTGSGYSDVPGSYGYVYNRNSSAGKGTGSSEALISFNIGDKIRAYVIRTVGSATITTVVNASRLNINPVKPRNRDSGFNIQAGNIANGITWSYNRIKAGSL